MTTYVDFQPPPSGAFQFQPTLDGSVYTCLVSWNIFGQRYYMDCYALDGTRVFTRAVVGSPVGYDISLTAGYFTTKLVYRAPTNQFETI